MGITLSRILIRTLAIITVTVVLASTAQAIESRQESNADSIAVAPATQGSEALYNGELIDLSKDWEGATTCIVIPDELDYAECFDSDADRDERLADLGLTERFAEKDGPEGASFASGYCSSYLKLYDGYWYSGSSLWMSFRGVWQNLSNFGFNQRTSSYKVGGCSTYLADWNNGGGAWIPTGASQAWDVDVVITGSWNNDISSIYIL